MCQLVPIALAVPLFSIFFLLIGTATAMVAARHCRQKEKGEGEGLTFFCVTKVPLVAATAAKTKKSIGATICIGREILCLVFL